MYDQISKTKRGGGRQNKKAIELGKQGRSKFVHLFENYGLVIGEQVLKKLSQVQDLS